MHVHFVKFKHCRKVEIIVLVISNPLVQPWSSGLISAALRGERRNWLLVLRSLFR